MPGQATVTINENQWSVSLATTYAELTQGLSGVEAIPAGTGMLFVLGTKQQVTIDTSQMLFPIDIIFISENVVIDVASDIQPGYLVTEGTLCDAFLEVNAGEAAGVEAGDIVSTAIIQQPGFDWSSIMSFAIPVAVLGFVCGMVGGIAGLIGGSSSPPKLLPETMKEAYYWTAINKDTGEIVEREVPYPTADKALKTARDWATKHWKGDTTLVEVWKQPYRYSENLKIQAVASEVVTETFKSGEIVVYKGERVRVLEHIGDRVSIFIPLRQEEVWIKPEALQRIEGKQPAVIPTEPRPCREGDLEYLADSPEFLTQTIEAIGYRDKLDTTFQEAIKRAKGLK